MMHYTILELLILTPARDSMLRRLFKRAKIVDLI